MAPERGATTRPIRWVTKSTLFQGKGKQWRKGQRHEAERGEQQQPNVHCTQGKHAKHKHMNGRRIMTPIHTHTQSRSCTYRTSCQRPHRACLTRTRKRERKTRKCQSARQKTAKETKQICGTARVWFPGKRWLWFVRHSQHDTLPAWSGELD